MTKTGISIQDLKLYMRNNRGGWMRAEEGRNLERQSWFSHRDRGRLAGPSTDTRCSKLWGRRWTGLCVFDVLGARVEGDVWAVRESGRIGVGMVVEAVRVSVVVAFCMHLVKEVELSAWAGEGQHGRWCSCPACGIAISDQVPSVASGLGTLRGDHLLSQSPEAG